MSFKIGEILWAMEADFSKEEIFVPKLATILGYNGFIKAYHIFMPFTNLTEIKQEYEIFDFEIEALEVCNNLNKTIAKIRERSKEKVSQ